MRPVSSAAINVDPESRNGSYTKPPRSVWFSRGRRISSTGFCVPCPVMVSTPGHNGDGTGRMVQLETPHLRLCTWDDSDLERFRPIATDPRVMRFITGGTPWPDERIQLFLRRNQETFCDHGFCRWKLEEKPSGDLIGFCGLGFLPGI